MTPRPPANVPRLWLLGITSGLFICGAAIVLLAIGVGTLFLARQLYAHLASMVARVVLRIWQIRVIVHRDGPWRRRQTVYISNHPSTLDLFILVALDLPNTRFFLSGFLQKFVPLGIIARMMGTFFTVPQERPAERVRIFERADRILRRTGASVYLSPEGTRVPDGHIGAFNKGAFHLATSLSAPIVPLYIDIPLAISPGKGYDARRGTVDVFVLPAVDTSAWLVKDVARNRDRVREVFVNWQRAHGRQPGEAA